jgi:hypothetical protein
MKTRIMILACLLAVPAGRMAAQQQTDPEQKATVQTQGDSIIIRKGKGDMRIKVYEEQLEDGEKKEVQIYEGVYLEKVDADKRTFLDALPFIPKKRRYNAYEPHCSGLYIGYSRLANDFLSFGASDIIFGNTGKRKYNLSYPEKQEQSGGNAADSIECAIEAGRLSLCGYFLCRFCCYGFFLCRFCH